jgi:ABC-type multidrug transport system ATPase subunit
MAITQLLKNPSIIFLDEPTSGLDSLAASTVMRGLKRIALAGRAVCATIHQPSIAIFNDFDELLLLKQGGDAVYFGELGENSSKLIAYLERYDATPKIQPGENPATWMLTTNGAGSANSNKKPFDYAGSYTQSAVRAQCLERINQICAEAREENKVSFPSEFATSSKTQSITVLLRAMTVYFRSPNYNLTRVMVSIVGKLGEVI